MAIRFVHRHGRAAAAVGVVLGATVAAAPAAQASAPAAAASAHASHKPRPYLAVGDSVTAGLQPTTGPAPTGGYVGVVAKGLAARHRSVRITNLACRKDETTATMLRGDGQCAYRSGTQTAEAERFLRRHRDTRLITVSIGANDLTPCRKGPADDAASCAARAIPAAGKNLDVMLGRFRRAAPHARIVVLDYYNPLLALQLANPPQTTALAASVQAQQGLNSVIHRAASRHGAKVAHVAAAFHSLDVRPTTVQGGVTLPRNVADICSWTWMCSKSDIHPNDTGYGVIGTAVLRRL